MAIADVKISDLPKKDRLDGDDLLIVSKASGNEVIPYTSYSISGSALSSQFEEMIETNDYSLSGQWTFNNKNKTPGLNYRYTIADIADALRNETKRHELVQAITGWYRNLCKGYDNFGEDDSKKKSSISVDVRSIPNMDYINRLAALVYDDIAKKAKELSSKIQQLENDERTISQNLTSLTQRFNNHLTIDHKYISSYVGMIIMTDLDNNDGANGFKGVGKYDPSTTWEAFSLNPESSTTTVKNKDIDLRITNTKNYDGDFGNKEVGMKETGTINITVPLNGRSNIKNNSEDISIVLNGKTIGSGSVSNPYNPDLPGSVRYVSSLKGTVKVTGNTAHAGIYQVLIYNGDTVVGRFPSGDGDSLTTVYTPDGTEVSGKKGFNRFMRAETAEGEDNFGNKSDKWAFHSGHYVEKNFNIVLDKESPISSLKLRFRGTTGWATRELPYRCRLMFTINSMKTASVTTEFASNGIKLYRRTH